MLTILQKYIRLRTALSCSTSTITFICQRIMKRMILLVLQVADLPSATNFQCKAGRIEFKNVSFGYNADNLVLRNLSFTVEPGKTLAVVRQLSMNILCSPQKKKN